LLSDGNSVRFSAVRQQRVAAHAQHLTMPLIGFLSARSPDESAHLLADFRSGLAENGSVEGQSVAIEYRWALGEYNRLPALAAELVGIPVAVLVAVGGEPAARAAKAATATIRSSCARAHQTVLRDGYYKGGIRRSVSYLQRLVMKYEFHHQLD
jgi:hypothetical protein